MAELQITELQSPGKIAFNYDELKTELTAKVQDYKTIVYTADVMKQAKADRANLNRLSKALNDERIKREKEFMAPFNEFKAQIRELCGIINDASACIDKQVKEYEEQQKQAKNEQIMAYFAEQQEDGLAPKWLDFAQIANPKWLNASTSMESIHGEIDEKCSRIKTDLDTIAELPEYSFEATEVYKRTLNITESIAEGKRLVEIQKKKQAELEAQKILDEKVRGQKQSPEEEIRAWEEKMDKPKTYKVAFEAELTVPQAKSLKAWFESENITYRAIKQED